MFDMDEETAGYFSAIQSDDGYLVSTDMDIDELEEIKNILRGMIEVRLSDETPERLH